MKKVYEGRILGFWFIAFIIGVLGFAKFGSDVVLLVIPFAMLWLFNYDLSSYDAKYGNDDTKKSS